MLENVGADQENAERRISKKNAGIKSLSCGSAKAVSGTEYPGDDRL